MRSRSISAIRFFAAPIRQGPRVAIQLCLASAHWRRPRRSRIAAGSRVSRAKALSRGGLLRPPLQSEAWQLK